MLPRIQPLAIFTHKQCALGKYVHDDLRRPYLTFLCRQCDQMTRVFVHYWDFYSNENLA